MLNQYGQTYEPATALALYGFISCCFGANQNMERKKEDTGGEGEGEGQREGDAGGGGEGTLHSEAGEREGGMLERREREHLCLEPFWTRETFC